MADYTHNELLVLHHLKRYGPIIATVERSSIYTDMAAELGMKVSTVKYLCRKLEDRCLVLRSYERPTKGFNETAGTNRLLRLELVDPNIDLPAIPQVYSKHEPPRPLPLAATMERENRELEEKVNHQQDHEPSVEDVIQALIDRIVELTQQGDKLMGIIGNLTKENERLTKAATPRPTHLSSQVRDVLSAEVWANLKKKQ